MSTKRLKKQWDLLKVLSKAKPKTVKAIIKDGDRELLHCLCECALNVLKGHVPLTPTQKKRLSRHKTHLRTLARRNINIGNKKKILQRGGFVGALLGPVLGTLATTILPGLFGRK